MKIKRNPIADDDTYYWDDNSCALLAIAYAFRVDFSVVQALFELAGRSINDGVTDEQVSKVLKVLGKLRKKKITYQRNTQRISIKNFGKANHGRYILNCDEHISYYNNRELVDEYLYCWRHIIDNPRLKAVTKLVGWWKIEDYI
jgi:hypothetical protein